jgi:glycosyltransferase involved in cell wall biosynthesis
MIRVLRIIARLNIGGPAIHVSLLTERLDPARYESTLVTGAESPGEGHYLDLHGRTLPRVVLVPQLGREIQGGQDVLALATLVRLVRRVRPHIVHTHTAKAGTLGRLAAWVNRVPVIVHTYHGHVLRGYFSPARTRAFVSVERALARTSSALIAVSPAVRDDLLALGIGSRSRFAVVPLGLDLDRFERADPLRGHLRRELGLPPDAPLVGIIARLVPIKAHEVFLEGAARLARARPDVRFVVVGDGERRAALEALAAARHLGERVRFLGWRSDLDRIYADLDVVALTSRNEGSPVALIEAMAAGRAVVSTAVGGVADVVTDNVTGWLVPVDDPDALAARIGALLADPGARARAGAAARVQVRDRYGAARLVDDIDRLYQDLLRGLPARAVPAGSIEPPAARRPVP